MSSKASRVFAAALFLSLSASIACEQSANATGSSEDAKPLSRQTIPADTQAQPAPAAEKTKAVQPGAVGKRTSAVRAQPAKPSAATEEFKPVVGQAGKDVVWVPTPQPLVDRMLDMANLSRNDIHFDLGSGDGRTVITAAKRGAKSTGVEYNPEMVAFSRRLAHQEGVGGKA
ncbi:MAG TPA: methyltransferase domain-containing protein, partial [Gemmatimonadaceae bacterium]|nr:methyltransferase domain-containing protein [Gemmatimonadaceae bacterium]